MQYKTVFAVLLVSLLIFGCTSPPAGGGTAPQGGVPAGQPQGTPPSPSPPAPQPNQTPAANASVQPPGGQPSGGVGDLIGKSFTDLVALNVPIKCQITTSNGTVTLYKGAGSDMRSEMPASEGLCQSQKMIFIVKGDKYYMGCEQGTIMPGSSCQWLVFNATGSTATAAPGTQAPDYSNVPAAQISCVPWVLDASLFQAPANACSLNDLENSISIPTG
jgi:hypothetical protein